jgi:hypothetical protein
VREALATSPYLARLIKLNLYETGDIGGEELEGLRARFGNAVW